MDYLPTDGFTLLNTISTIFSFVLGASIIPFVYNVTYSWKYGRLALRDDPWGHGNSLEATSPRRHNFIEIPKIRPSGRPSRRTTRTCWNGCKWRRTARATARTRTT